MVIMKVFTAEHRKHQLESIRTPEYRKKMSGIVKTRCQDAEYCKRMGEAIKIGLNKPEVVNRRSKSLKKYYSNPTNRKRMSDICKQVEHTTEWNNNVSESLKGRIFTEEHRRNIGKTHCGEKNYGWLGGVSFLPYSHKFTKHLKESVKARDDYHCRICGTEDKLYVHHIDYDKLNTAPINLISLCLSCHMKTNFNRNCWKEYLFYKNLNSNRMII